MTTLAVVGTAGGVGTSTVAALAFAGTRDHPGGAPLLYALPGAGLGVRAGDTGVAAVVPEAVIWDAGVQSPSAAAALVREGCVLAVVAPSTPLGVVDATAVLHAVAGLGDGALDRVVTVLVQVTRGSRPGPVAGLGARPLRLPWDPRLAEPGPVPSLATVRRRTRTAVGRWQHRATAALGA